MTREQELEIMIPPLLRMLKKELDDLIDLKKGSNIPTILESSIEDIDYIWDNLKACNTELKQLKKQEN